MVKTIITDNFQLDTKIETSTFIPNSHFLFLVKDNLNHLDCNLRQLEINTYLRDVYKMGENTFNKIILAKKEYPEIHKNQVKWIIDFFNRLRNLKSYNNIYPYCPVLNQHPLQIKDNVLQGKEDLIIACTPERKGDISSSYGEGLGYTLLLNTPNTSQFGVLKISNGQKSTPDFIVINNKKEIVMVSEVKSSINNNPNNPKEQLEKVPRYINGLGIQVKFNKGNSPIEMILKDPEYNLLGTIFPAIYTNISVLESLLKLNENDEFPIIEVKDIEKYQETINQFKNIIKKNNLEKINLTNIIVDNMIYTDDDELDTFFDLYFSLEINGLDSIFKR